MDDDLIGPSRPCLSHEWEQGNYVEGGVLEGRVDWDALDEMERHAKEIIERTLAEFESYYVAWSGGIDSQVLLKLLADIGRTDIDCIFFTNSCYYPCIREFSEAYPPELGFEPTVKNNTDRDMQWAVEHSDMIPPTNADKQEMLNTGYRRKVRTYNREADIDVWIAGHRNEVNTTGKYFMDHFGTTRCAPIRTWTTEHVVAFCDRYDIPLNPFYFEMPQTGGYPWYRRRITTNEPERHKRDVDQFWYWVRRVPIRAGYTDFWKRIREHFPDGSELASQWAARQDLTFVETERGYELGCDAVDSVLNATPEHLDGHREHVYREG